MVSFRDTSAVMALVLQEPYSQVLRSLYTPQRTVVAWWGTRVEGQSAVERRYREKVLSLIAKREAQRCLSVLADGWLEVQPLPAVQERASRLVSLHSLPSVAALQLAAALMWAGEEVAGKSFVCLDARLREAAAKEGFTILPETIS